MSNNQIHSQMKKTIAMSVLLTLSAVLAAQTTLPEPEKFKVTWEWVVVAITSLYEFTSRVIPTPKDYTVLGQVLKYLGKLSDLLNRKK